MTSLWMCLKTPAVAGTLSARECELVDKNAIALLSTQERTTIVLWTNSLISLVHVPMVEDGLTD